MSWGKLCRLRAHIPLKLIVTYEQFGVESFKEAVTNNMSVRLSVTKRGERREDAKSEEGKARRKARHPTPSSQAARPALVPPLTRITMHSLL